MQDFWNDRFSDPDYIYGKEPNIFVKKFLDDNDISGKKLCFIAEGEGRNAVYAAKKGGVVQAYDYSLEAKRKAENLAREFQVTIDYQQLDLTTGELPVGQFDFLITVFCHMRPSERTAVHHKFVKALAPGGKLLLVGYEKKQIHNKTGGPERVEALFSLEDLSEDFRGLNILRNEHLECELQEGKYHQGKSDLIILEAQKTL